MSIADREWWASVLSEEEEMVRLRHEFHQNPELSGQEELSCRRILCFLQNENIECVNVPNGGVLGFIRGEAASARPRSVLLRADMDALPIDEEPINLSVPRLCQSRKNGVAHMCGHDAHTVMLLYAAKILQRMKEKFSGTAVLMFERGEEKTINVTRLFHYLEIHNISIDTAFGLHMHPELDSGKIAVNDGPVMASNVCFDVRIMGRGGHGSRPDLAASPIDCFAAFYQALASLRMKSISPFRPMTYSIGYLHAGETNNVIPNDLLFRGSARFFDFEDGERFKAELTRLLDQITLAYDCTYRYELLRGPCFPVINQKNLANLLRENLGELIGSEKVCQCEPLLGSETFARTMAKWPGVFCLLGTRNPAKGTGAPLHSARFDVDDEVLKYGMAAHVAYTLAFLQSHLDTAVYPGSFADLYTRLKLPEDQIRYLRGELEDYSSL